MTRLVRTIGIAMAFIAGARLELGAQSAQPMSLELSGAGNFAMDANPALDPQSRPAVEGQARYTFSRFSLGIGAVIQSPQNNLRQLRGSAFVEPRYVVGSWPGKAFYLATRFGYGRFICTTRCTDEDSHVTYGAGAGILIRVSPRVNADLGAEYFRVANWSASGYSLLRAGLTLGL
ncbi:MAG: hypothetical protein ACREK8_10300 [Gemmatimonadales bacterium]